MADFQRQRRSIEHQSELVQHVAAEQHKLFVIIADCLYLDGSLGPDRDAYEIDGKAVDLSAESTDLRETH